MTASNRESLLPTLLLLFAGLLALPWFAAPAVMLAQSYDGTARSRVHSMLNQIRDDVRKNYFDPSYRGIDFEAHFRRASDKLDQAKSFNQALAVIAQALLDFNDSHTFFSPPSRAGRVDYGWRHRMVGDACLVTDVRPQSDAEAKGLKPGDRIIDIQGFRPNRRDLWKITYFFGLLNPMPGLRLTVESPGGQLRQLEIEARISPAKRTIDATDIQTWLDLIAAAENEAATHRFQRVGDVLIWKMTAFDLSPDEVNDVMRSRVKEADALVLDLRGNGGGAVETLERLLSHFFDHDITIAERKGRKKMDPMVARKRSDRPFAGPIVVLVDAQSGSASEIFARVMQLEKRATVLGDRSAGSVMQARYFSGQTGSQSVVLFGASVTEADVIMADGRSLEGVGVAPDEVRLPTPDDLAAGRDPVLARAIALLGGTLDPETAGKLFPTEWKR